MFTLYYFFSFSQIQKSMTFLSLKVGCIFLYLYRFCSGKCHEMTQLIGESDDRKKIRHSPPITVDCPLRSRIPACPVTCWPSSRLNGRQKLSYLLWVSPDLLPDDTRHPLSDQREREFNVKSSLWTSAKQVSCQH